ncbi:hypothetical protein D3C76_802000 [compost metagenome]
MKLALLVILPVGHAQQRLGQAINAVHDFRQEIAFDAVQSAIDLGFHITMSGDHPIVLGRHHDAAPGAAKAARRFIPVQGHPVFFGDQVAGRGKHREPRRRCGDPGSLGFDKLASSHRHVLSPVTSRVS